MVDRNRKVGLWMLLIFSCLTVGVMAQEAPKFSVRVRKSVDCNEVSVLPAPVVVAERVAVPVDSIVSYPRLMGGSLALMPIVLYVEAKAEEARRARHQYVVFEVTVDERGMATNIIFHDTNNKYLATVLKKHLLESRWHPARTASGREIAYKYPLQFITVPYHYESRDMYED